MDHLIDIWVVEAIDYERGREGVDELLVNAVQKAAALRAQRSVTTEQVVAQLPSVYPKYWPNAEAEWDIRSVAQRLSALADRGLILRVGMRAHAGGGPAVQHWRAP